MDNGASGTGNSSNSYACENTEDYIFLLSYAEATNKAYGLSGDYYRQMLASDLARATGVHMSVGGGEHGNGTWWLRSPTGSASYYVRYVYGDGYIASSGFASDVHGVVPALRIAL